MVNRVCMKCRHGLPTNRQKRQVIGIEKYALSWGKINMTGHVIDHMTGHIVACGLQVVNPSKMQGASQLLGKKIFREAVKVNSVNQRVPARFPEDPT